MNKPIEKLDNSMFYLKGRKAVTNLKKLKITSKGVIIPNKNIGNNTLFEKKNTNIENYSPTLGPDNNVFVIAYNLGKYVHDNKGLLKDFAECYIKNENIENLQEIRMARIHDNIDINKIGRINLEDIYRNINIEKINNINFSDMILRSPKSYKDKKLNSYLIKWFNTCGITDKEIADFGQTNDENEIIIFMPYILKILDICLTVYELYQGLWNGNFKDNLIIHSTIELRYDKKKKLVIQNRVTNIEDLCFLSTLSQFKMKQIDGVKGSDIVDITAPKNHFKICEYCNDYFFGRKNKKCCSQYCKDKKNNKYEKRQLRKEQEKRSDTECRKKQI